MAAQAITKPTDQPRVASCTSTPCPRPKSSWAAACPGLEFYLKSGKRRQKAGASWCVVASSDSHSFSSCSCGALEQIVAELHAHRACWNFFFILMVCIYLIKSYVNLDANKLQPSGCLATRLVCSRCWKSLRTTLAPRKTCKRVILLLFFLIKVIVPQPSLVYLPAAEGKGYFLLFSLCCHCS